MRSEPGEGRRVCLRFEEEVVAVAGFVRELWDSRWEGVGALESRMLARRTGLWGVWWEGGTASWEGVFALLLP